MSLIVVAGAGAAGVFAAIKMAEANSELEVIILEKSDKPLYKVSISGGGRCNVTHACFEPKELSKNYPRGQKELLGPFHSFQPGDTIAWFEDHGVELKMEEDGRMFPTSDDSQTIIDCFMEQLSELNIPLLLKDGLDAIHPTADGKFEVLTNRGKVLLADKIIMATGSASFPWKILAGLGHHIVEAVPSLFTFNTKDTRLKDMMGISVEQVVVQIESLQMRASGPLLITHWGVSGPAILRLSAWGARELAACNYKFLLSINWCGAGVDEELMKQTLLDAKLGEAKKHVANTPLFSLPLRLWKNLVNSCVQEERKWADISREEMQALGNTLLNSELAVNGKSTYKDEFVTCGGVALNEVNFKTMESKLIPGLYFAGEVLDIDAITGGFNFQAAWTTAHIAAKAISDAGSAASAI